MNEHRAGDESVWTHNCSERQEAARQLMELGGILSTAFRMAVHKMACGQSFAAVCKGMAECTPNARAVILYRIEDQDVVILRVLRGSRKIAALFSP